MSELPCTGTPGRWGLDYYGHWKVYCRVHKIVVCTVLDRAGPPARYGKRVIMLLYFPDCMQCASLAQPQA